MSDFNTCIQLIEHFVPSDVSMKNLKTENKKKKDSSCLSELCFVYRIGFDSSKHSDTAVIHWSGKPWVLLAYLFVVNPFGCYAGLYTFWASI